MTAVVSFSFLVIDRTFAANKITSFTDVSAGAWYEAAASDLIELGALDATQTRLRPNDLATRAEMVELLVRLRRQALQSPARRSFSDVPMTASYYEYMETAARVGWVRGDGDCYGTYPCTARPNSGVNRAEAATLLMRVFALPSTNAAPVFFDNGDQNAWYYETIQTAADHCVLQGDDQTRLVRPASGMNRAEMIVMFDRASKNLEYGMHCGTEPEQKAELSSAVALSSTVVSLTFSTGLDRTVAHDDFRYVVSLVGGGRIAVEDAALIGDRTIHLTLGSNLSNQSSYRVNVVDLKTAAGVTFSDDRSFVFHETAGKITTVTAESSLRIRVQFNTDMNGAAADDAYRYNVREISTNAFLGVNSVSIIDSRTVELKLSSALKANVLYLLGANDVMTQNGIRFNDNSSFRFNEAAAELSSITPVNATTLRLTFSTDLDETAAESVAKYRVTGNGRDLLITRANLVNTRLVDISLGEAMESQRIYTVTATDLSTSGDVLFSDTASLLYVGAAELHFGTTLIGAKEVPAVTVALSGTGAFTLTAAGLTYDITLANMSGSIVTGAHFHRGAIGSNGPILQSIPLSGHRATGTWTGLSEQDRNDLQSGGIYVNVHTQAYPNGAIRGQVSQQ